jgi:hypothetical protein
MVEIKNHNLLSIPRIASSRQGEYPRVLKGDEKDSIDNLKVGITVYPWIPRNEVEELDSQ